jgi:hypothetical protein
VTPESPIVAELRPILDAVCEDAATPEQFKRLEELVLAHPEAEAFYVRFMGFYADLIGHVAGLPQPKPMPAQPPAEVMPVSAPQATPAAPAAPVPPKKARSWPRWQLAAAVLVAVGVSAFGGVQYAGWAGKSREAREAQAALDARRNDLAHLHEKQEAIRRAAQVELEKARADAQAVLNEQQAALAAARQAIEAKDFHVRLTGPAHVQPGAPNRWQIETLRRGAVARPKKMEVVVRDAADAELFRQTHDKPVGAATLELGPAFWEKVKPGADLFLEVVAYTDDDRTSAVAEKLPLARPVYVTDLATDKPLYKPGETVRFRSLTLDRASLKPPAHDLHLKFRLRDPSDAAVPVAEANGRLLAGAKPVTGPDGKPLRGIGVGEYTIGTEAPGGEYKLDLFEVAGGKDVLLETRKFVVNRYVPDVFEKKLEFDGKSYGPGDYVQARIDVSRTAGGPMKDARADVLAAVDGKPVHDQKDAKFTLVTDRGTAKTVLDVRFKLPADLFGKGTTPPNATLSVRVRDGSDVEAIVRPIPLVTKTLLVEFYPEGGELVAGVPGRVYFQVRTPLGKPADLKGYVTDGTGPVADAATLTDAEAPGVNRGHGVFALTPKAGTRYFLKLAAPLGITEPTPDGFPLPEAKEDGVALTALDAVTEKGAPVRVRVQCGRGPKTLHVGAYARGRLVAHRKLDTEAGKPVEVALAGDDAAGGVTRVTVFEEAKGDGPVKVVPRAERLVYRKPAEGLALSVTADRPRYTPGGKVRLDLAAATEAGKPVPAVLLVAVVNQSVIAMADNKTDRLMPTHVLLSGEVKHPAELEHADFLLTDHPRAGAALDLLLGTQGWRRFAEQTGTAANPADRSEVDRLLVAEGQRTGTPVGLYQLEEQRVRAEFGPRVDQARQAVSAAAVNVQAGRTVTDPGLPNQMAAARAAVSAAEREAWAAKAALEEANEWRDRLLGRLAWVLVIGLILVVVVLLIRAIVIETAAKSNGRGLAYLTLGVVAVMGLMVVSLMTLNSTANRTFSYVGSSIRPPGESRASGEAPSDTMAVPRLPAWDSTPKSAPVPDQKARNRNEIDDTVGVPNTDRNDDIAYAPAGLEGKIAGEAVDRVSGRKGLTGRSASGQSAPWFGPRLRVHNEYASAEFREKLGLTEDLPANLPEQGRFADRTPSDRRSFVPPTVVREYAHRRDPALGPVRADFTETVYWHPVLVLPGTGKATVEFQLSDDIARYRVLVAGHTLDGRIGAVTQSIETRRPFSVDPKVPLEVSHTDTVDVPVRVTNDSPDPRAVAFSVTATGLKVDGDPNGRLDLGPNGKGRRVVRLRPDRLEGDGGVAVTGTSPGADADTIVRAVRVVPDGFPGVGSFSDVIEGRARGRVVLPKDVVPGSLRVRLEVYPTSLADLVKGLDGLLREPGGCFEQTSTSNYPNTLVLDYLNQTNQTSPAAAKRARELLDRGYARLTTFECPDTPLKTRHGFEWFGAADMQHEALTAYGLLQFKDMARVHPVDPELIRRTQQFLLSRRDGKGGFMQNSRNLHSWGASKEVVNAYIVWALAESDPDDAERLDLRTEIAALKRQALDETSAAGKDAYFVALVANVMLLRGDREAAHRLLDRLQEKHTKDGVVDGAVTSITRSGGRDLQIETTALALLGWLRANDPKYAPTVKAATRWVSRQRGGYGGFGSTQSTIMALKALTLHAKKNAHPPEPGTLRVLVGGKEAAARGFTEQDVEVTGLDVPAEAFGPGANEVEVVTDAKQAYPFALAYTYTTLTPVSAEKCAVAIGTKLARGTAAEGETVPLAVTLENRRQEGQGMAVVVIGLPAGMKVPTDLKQLTDLREKGQVSYFETRGRELVLYWRELAPGQKVALSIDLVCDVPGVYRGPASRGYLYYDADHKHWVEPLAVTITPAGE